MTRSLGTCQQPKADSVCGGQLMVDQEVGGIVEAVCDRCEIVVGRPVGRPQPELDAEPERVEESEPWWFK